MKIIHKFIDYLRTYPITWFLLANTLIWVLNTLYDEIKKTQLVIGLVGGEHNIRLIFVWMIVELLALVLFLIQIQLFKRRIKEEIRLFKENEKPDEEMICMKTNKAYYDKLATVVEANGVIQSVQIYECPDLIDPKDISSDGVVFGFKRIGGYSRENYVTNCVLFERFECSEDIYRKLHPILKKMRNISYRKDRHNRVRPSEIADIGDLVKSLTAYIKSKCFNISDVSAVSEEQFFYYSSLQLLLKYTRSLSTAEGEHVYVNNTGYILNDIKVPSLVEDYLKRAKRTGLLGAYFKKGLYLFGNENSNCLEKQNRHYFAVPLAGFDNRFGVFTYDHTLLDINEDMSEYACCKDLLKDFNLEMGGIK